MTTETRSRLAFNRIVVMAFPKARQAMHRGFNRAAMCLDYIMLVSNNDDRKDKEMKRTFIFYLPRYSRMIVYEKKNMLIGWG